METTAIERRDVRIKQDVLKELDWDPRVDVTDVGVEVRESLVALSGRGRNYGKKIAAQEAAHRVKGVLDVANEIEVRIPSDEMTDEDIARAVRRGLEWDVMVPHGDIHTTVTDGWVVLDGTVARLIEKAEATRVVERLEGVLGVSNDLEVRAKMIAS